MGAMSGRESKVLRSSKQMSRPASPSRTVGNSHIYLLFILVLGFLFVFSYQYEIHTLIAREGLYTSVSGNGSEPLTKPNLNAPHSDARVESTDRSRPREEKQVLAVTSEKVLHSTLTQRKLESQPNNSSETPAPAEKNRDLEPQPNNSSKTPVPAKKKRDTSWKDHKVEAYIPLVDSVQSNILSARFQLVIKVLALNNYPALVQCLSSLSKAEYAGDTVDIHIYIDHFEITDAAGSKRRLLTKALGKELKSSKDSHQKTSVLSTKARLAKNKKQKVSSTARTSRKLEDNTLDSVEEARVPDRLETGVDSVQQSDWELVEQRLSEARQVLDHVESFQWKHGKKVIHYRTRAAGSQSQWLDAWWPSSDDEFALFVEDDTEVSPLYYRYVRSLIATYNYNWSHYDPSLYGISLQRPQIVPGKNGRPLKVDERTRLFKYQMIGIWGQIFFPKPWKEFRRWYDTQKSHDIRPTVDGLVTTDWYKEFGEKMFTPWFVKFAYNRGYFNLYTNFLRDRVLSVTHRDTGSKTKKYAGCDSVLIFKNGTYDIDIWHMAANWNIKRYDYCFREVRVGRFANYSSDVSWVLYSAQQDNRILIVSTVGVPEDLVRNGLCKLRKLGIENYLIVGEDPVLLEDLARRGHATMRIENQSGMEEDIEKEVNAVSTVLKNGHDVWFTRADVVWLGNPLEVVSTEGADVIGLENAQLDLFFIRNTEETTRFWGSLNQELSEVPVNVSRLDNWERAREKFLKACQEEEKVRMQPLQKVMFIDGVTLNLLPNAESSGDVQLLMLSGLRSFLSWEIKEKVAQLNSWYLDSDLACAELTC